MVKYYLKDGREVKVGDVITITSSKSTEFGKTTTIESFTLTEKVIPTLITQGLITTSDNSNEKNEEIPMVIGYYVRTLASKKKWDTEETYKYISKAYEMCPSAALSILLKEIAVELDKQYKDHIKNSPEIWVVSMLDGRIVKINKASIKSYNNFAAFRTLGDARIACKIVRPLLKDMFKNGEQKDKKCSEINL